MSPFLNELDNIDLWSVDIDNPDKILSVDMDDDNVSAVTEAVKNAGYKIQRINWRNVLRIVNKKRQDTVKNRDHK